MKEKSMWESIVRIYEWLNAYSLRRRRHLERQRNMLAGVVAVVLVDLLVQVFVR